LADPARSGLAFAALGFALAAAFSSWNPISAPFGLFVGVGAGVAAFRALRGGGRKVLSGAALALSVGAVVASALVLALTAGVGRELGGTPVVPVPPRDEVNQELDRAAERTRAARERARAELDSLEKGEGGGGKGEGRRERR
jgi:hypothetical protein